MEYRAACGWIVSLMLIGVLPAVAAGDTFTYVDRDGETQTVEGALAGSGQGMHALEKPDGSMVVIPQGSLTKREVAPPPEPISAREMEAQLIEQFGADGIRTKVDGSYVVGLVLAGPLPERSETRVTGFLNKAAEFLGNVEYVVTRFCRDLRINPEPPRYPLVTLIFETDHDFNEYIENSADGTGLSAERVLGFYSPLTNWLALRMSECRTFQVPLHEAVHQQVFNRGLMQRLSGVPVWFNEGIATGFENNGERINIGPNKVNATYARRLIGELNVSWEQIVKDDSAFHGDILAGEAYAQAWGLHWLLVNEYRPGYVRYLQKLGQIAPLERPTPEERSAMFEEAFSDSLAEMEEEFPRHLQTAMRRQRIPTNVASRPGRSVTFGDAGAVELKAVKRQSGGGMTEVEGRLTNVSPFRDFAYHVTVQTTGGLYAEWFLPSVGSDQTVQLSQQYVMKRIPGAPGEESQSYWVEITSALPDGDVVAQWKENGLPVPEWKPR